MINLTRLMLICSKYLVASTRVATASLSIKFKRTPIFAFMASSCRRRGDISVKYEMLLIGESSNKVGRAKSPQLSLASVLGEPCTGWKQHASYSGSCLWLITAQPAVFWPHPDTMLDFLTDIGKEKASHSSHILALGSWKLKGI